MDDTIRFSQQGIIASTELDSNLRQRSCNCDHQSVAPGMFTTETLGQLCSDQLAPQITAMGRGTKLSHPDETVPEIGYRCERVFQQPIPE